MSFLKLFLYIFHILRLNVKDDFLRFRSKIFLIEIDIFKYCIEYSLVIEIRYV